MGRPIKKSWFGDPASDGYQITISANIDDQIGEGFIVAQKGTRKYLVNINGSIGIAKLVNKSSLGELLSGEAFILAQPFGSTESFPVHKLTQHRLVIHGVDGFESYVWSKGEVAEEGEAELVSGGGGTPVPLEITQNPTDQTLIEGDELVLSSDGLNFTLIEWLKEGSVITGENAKVLTISNTTQSDSGNYQVRYSNDTESLTSQIAVVQVNVAVAQTEPETEPKEKKKKKKDFE